MTDLTRADLLALDEADPLASCRDLFDLPDGVIYLDGNSLGALPRATAGRMQDVIRREWGQDLIRSWNTNGWIDAATRVGAKIATLIGAKAHEVVVADSTSVNLFKVVAGAVGLRPDRMTILSEPGNFPTDLYIIQGLQALLGGRVVLRTVPADRIVAAIDDDTAVVVLTHVHYKSGHRHPMAEVTRAAHAKGALVVWDLSHSVGALAVDLNGCDADLAIGCGYKYLNGGPGAPAFLFVAERHQAAIRSPLTGWMGHAAPFAFDDEYRPAGTIKAQLCGTPPILGIAALEVGVDISASAGLPALEAKSARLCDLFARLAEERCDFAGLTLISPRDPAMRGSHISFAHPDGYAIVQALIARGVIGDFRAPDVLRFGFAPLYLRYADIWDAVEAMRAILSSGEHRRAEFKTVAAVT
jgi:kynureninase